MAHISATSEPNGQSGSPVRAAAVAGQFYSDDPAQLAAQIDRFIVKPQTALSGRVRMLIMPHAGYVFSGPVAGAGYACLDSGFTTVILIGPSHYVPFSGVSIAEVSAYETPLGQMALASDKIARLRKSRLAGCVPQAHVREHSLEVQIPFLQRVLPAARLIPIVMGKVDPAEVADLLEPLVDEQTLVIASSDLSHFFSQAKAKETDQATLNAILAGNVMGDLDGCGEGPIRVIMHLGKRMGLLPVLLDARTSHETAPAFCAADRVVGYAAVAWVEPKGAQEPVAFTLQEQRQLLDLARASLEAAVRGEAMSPLSEPAGVLLEKRGCFVTLTINGALRGCIGCIEPIHPLWQGICDNALNAALRDPRFEPVTSKDLDKIKIEVSVLTPPRVLNYTSAQDLLDQLVPGVDGVILSDGRAQATFLPQVWEQLPQKTAFLQHLARKAGLGANDWQHCAIKRYRVAAFHEG